MIRLIKFIVGIAFYILFVWHKKKLSFFEGVEKYYFFSFFVDHEII
jgi:hypothetical protein